MFIIHIITIILIIRIMIIISIIVIMHIILIILLFQVRIDLGLADHVWQNKRAAIAQKVDWAFSFVKPCAMVGLNTSRLHHMLPSPRRRQRAHPFGRGRWSWKMIKDDFLLQQNDDFLLLESLEADFRNEYSPATPFLFLRILRIIAKIIKIIVE
jgi:hypothetical protein